jgi:hypothetical protein
MSHLIAKEIVSFCTSCKRDLMHVIEAVDGDKIVRVHCKTCKRQHAYRPPRESEAQGGLKKPGPSPKKRKTASLFDEWEKIMEATKDFPAKAYDVHERFQVWNRGRQATHGPQQDGCPLQGRYESPRSRDLAEDVEGGPRFPFKSSQGSCTPDGAVYDPHS